MSATPLTFRQALSIPSFRRLWIAQAVSVFGDFLAVFAVFAVATFRLHATAPQITFILVMYLLPLGVISPLAGVLVDRWNLKRTMISSDLLRAAIASLLLFATHLWQIYAIFFALAAVSAFFVPAQSVLLRTMVPSHGLMAANALMSQAMQVTQIISPAIAGALVASVGPNACFWFDVASFLFSACMVWAIDISGEHAVEGRTVDSFVTDMTAGMRFIFTHRAVSFVMVSMTVGLFAVRCFGALLAVWVRDVLAAGPASFGVLNSFVGVGMICATQFVHRFGAKRSKPSLVVFGLTAAGAFILLVACGPTLISTALGMFGMGLGIAFVFIPAQTLLQQVTPREMLGRVSSSMMSSFALTQTVALLLSGSVAQAVGIRPLYFASALMLAAIAGYGWRRLAVEEAVPVEA
jgi:MFS family permease